MSNGRGSGAAVCRHTPNTLGEDVIYKIHPAMGIARLGDSGDFFIGPEIPGRSATGADAGRGTAVPPFKSGGVKRQAARFRVWKYKWDDAKCQYIPKQEVKWGDPGIKNIRWKVQLANRKASFYDFRGTNGEISPYSSNANFKDDKRNPGVVGNRQVRSTKLDIDPEPVYISGPSAGPNPIQKTKPGVFVSYLGELLTDSAGRLLVLGGKGVSGSPASSPIHQYANNPGWFDDVSDGQVSVEIQLNSGRWIDFDSIFGAWVLVAPPDFAPPVANIVTLYETMTDVALRHLTIDPENGLFDAYDAADSTKGLKRLKEWKADFSVGPGFGTLKPSFTREIEPIFQRLFAYKWVHGGRQPDPASAGNFLMDQPTALTAHSWNLDDLADPSPGKQSNRDLPFFFLRVPLGMSLPTGASSGGYMPKLLGDEEIDDPARYPEAQPGNPKEFLTLTGVQYALLSRWWKGNFDKDGYPSVPPPRTDITPEGLDRAALENCVGGAFFPGIETGWLIRNPKLYLEPFRVDPWERDSKGKVKVKAGEFEKDPDGNIRKDPDGNKIPLRVRKKIPYGDSGAPDRLETVAGYFSQQMAQPWQADFISCSLEPHGTRLYGWWPGQRPDTTTMQVSGADQSEVWDRGITSRVDFVAHWNTRGFVEPAGAEFLEAEGPPATAAPAVPVVPPPLPSTTPGTSSGGGGVCFIATAAYGSPNAAEVRLLQELRDNILRGTDWGRGFFETYWKYYYRISPAIAEEMKRDPQLRQTVRWSIVEPWTYYLKLLLARPDWDRIDWGTLDPSLASFLSLLRQDMDAWVSRIEIPRSFAHLDPAEAARQLNVILGYVLRTGGLQYLDEMRAAGNLPLSYPPSREDELIDLLRQGGRTPEEIQRILSGTPL